MNVRINVLLVLVIVGFLASTQSQSAEHPSLTMTKAGVERIRAELGTVPLFDATLLEVRAEVDAEIALGIHTPIPKDFSGGYTHQRHKQNFLVLQKAGLLFQILEDEKYAKYIRDMLFQYEAMYMDLPLHPQTRSYARGKLFWQCLNDANWLLFVSQAYDSIYSTGCLRMSARHWRKTSFVRLPITYQSTVRSFSTACTITAPGAMPPSA